jgi:translation initiation factor 2 alpha subunit (eIF-2alpha)
VDSRLVKVKANDEYTRIYKAFENAVEENKSALAGFSKAWIKNFQKRILEAS